MSDKLADRPVTLMISMGVVLAMLWIVMGYDPEDASAQNALQYYAARMR